MTKVFHVKKLSPSVRESDLVKLRDTINQILGDDSNESVKMTLDQALKSEQQRHRKALRDIVLAEKKKF